MRKIFLYVFSAFVSIISIDNANAQCVVVNGQNIGPDGKPCINTIVSAVPFLRITPDARSGAMGDAGIALSADPNAIHFNPSKLPFSESEMGVAMTYTPWLRALGLTDVYLANLAGYRKIGDRQAVGIGLKYFNLGSINFTDEAGVPLGTGRPNEFEISATYARKLSSNFGLSLSGKYIYSNLAAGQQIGSVTIKAANAFAVDFGATYITQTNFSGIKSDLALGLAISNIGSKITYTQSINKDYLPQNIGLGAAWNFHIDEYNSLTFALDINKLLVPTPVPSKLTDGNNTIPNPDYDKNGNSIPDYKEKSPISAALSSFSDASGSEELRELTYSAGAEYWYDKQFAVRAGYYYEDNTKGARKYFTVGLGLKYNIFGMNFSYLVPTTNQRNPLDNTLRFSLLFDFAPVKEEATPVTE
jgi:hypothetical protein